jgi:predicted small lipoprotein YifL
MSQAQGRRERSGSRRVATRQVARVLGITAVALTMLTGVGGCGQKGPLFLPDQKLEEIKRKKDERDRRDAAKKSSALPVSPGALPGNRTRATTQVG